MVGPAENSRMRGMSRLAVRLICAGWLPHDSCSSGAFPLVKPRRVVYGDPATVTVEGARRGFAARCLAFGEPFSPFGQPCRYSGVSSSLVHRCERVDSVNDVGGQASAASKAAANSAAGSIGVMTSIGVITTS